MTIAAAVCAFNFQATVNVQQDQQQVQQKLTMVKQGVADNQAALRQYTWIEQTNVLLKGEIKKTTYYRCQYDPDGTVQKMDTGAFPPPSQPRGRVRQHVIEKKTDELESYMQQAGALVKKYVPPNPEQMKANFEAGNTSLGQGGPGTVQLQFRNYVKPEDSLTLTFVPAQKALAQINVNTYMDNQKNTVTLQVTFQKLPEGPNYAAQTVLNAPAKNIQVQTISSNFQRIGH